MIRRSLALLLFLVITAMASLMDPADGTASTSGWASYCLPTPTRCQSWGGAARLGAVPSFRWGDDPYTVNVCREDDASVCVTVRVVSYCGCGNKLIDLSGYAFTRLAPLSRGVVRVVVRRIELPPTDTEPPTSAARPAGWMLLS